MPKKTLSMFDAEASEETHPFHFALVSGMALLFAKRATSLVMTSHCCNSKVHCDVYKLCVETNVEPPRQSVQADTVTQCAIASGALVALVSLLDVSFHPEANCANVDKAEFKKEVRALITYFITRGECRRIFTIILQMLKH